MLCCFVLLFKTNHKDQFLRVGLNIFSDINFEHKKLRNQLDKDFVFISLGEGVVGLLIWPFAEKSCGECLVIFGFAATYAVMWIHNALQSFA